MIFGKKEIEIKNIPIRIQRNEYKCSRYFFLTKYNTIKIIIIPIKNAINRECKESIFYFFNFILTEVNKPSKFLNIYLNELFKLNDDFPVFLFFMFIDFSATDILTELVLHIIPTSEYSNSWS